jgi:hypothetical protein
MAIPLRTMKILGAPVFSEDRADCGNNGHVIRDSRNGACRSLRPSLLRRPRRIAACACLTHPSRPAEGGGHPRMTPAVFAARSRRDATENWRKIGAIAARGAKSLFRPIDMFEPSRKSCRRLQTPSNSNRAKNTSQEEHNDSYG